MIELSIPRDPTHEAKLALIAYAGMLRREARKRSSAGPYLADYRRRLRERAAYAASLAEGIRAGDYELAVRR